ncbi:MAG: transporter [Gracilimonas sp.]
MKYTHLFAALLFLLITNSAYGQETFPPDRPGIGNGSAITPNNMLGVEAGLQFTTSEFVDQFDVGQLLLRYGLAEKLEIRALLNSYSSATLNTPTEELTNSGFNDVALGAKYNIIPTNENRPNVSALLEVSLPFGSDAFTADEVVPVVGILADQTLGDFWGISSNFGYTFGAGDLEDSWLYTLTPGFTLPGNENIAGYAGYAGMYYGEGVNQHWLEGGMTYSLENGSQLDVNLGYETEGEIFFIGAGFAIGL